MKRTKEILDECKRGGKIERESILFLLNVRDAEEQKEIFAAAREVRDGVFQRKVFLYGFAYFSTYCQNNCAFCYYRRDNQKPSRYRKTLDEIVEIARELKEFGVHLIDLTTGEDPYYTKNPQRLAEVIRAVRAETDLSIMASPGLLDGAGIERIREAGADWYALYQEMHDRSLFGRLRPGQDYDARMQAKRYAVSQGLLIEEGLLTGVGDTAENKVDSFMEMERLQASQVRTMTFMEQDGAPLLGDFADGGCSELLNIAVMRLLFPDKLIPASLDVEGLKGLEKRLMAGANVVTSIIPPMKGYAGVASRAYDIDEGRRTVWGIQDTLRKCGMSAAALEDYKKWVKERKRILGCGY